MSDTAESALRAWTRSFTWMLIALVRTGEFLAVPTVLWFGWTGTSNVLFHTMTSGSPSSPIARITGLILLAGSVVRFYRFTFTGTLRVDQVLEKRLAPVLFLRPFARDRLTIQPDWFVMRLSIFAHPVMLVTWVLSIPLRRVGSDITLRDALLGFGNMGTWLAGALRDTLRRDTVCVGNPADIVMPPEITSVYVDSDGWRDAVPLLAKRAPCVLLMMGDTPGLRWELAMLRDTVRPERVFLLAEPRPPWDVPWWEDFADVFSDAGIALRPGLPLRTALIGFNADWETVELAYPLRTPIDYARAISDHLAQIDET
jgi:hypothetical protein